MSDCAVFPPGIAAAVKVCKDLMYLFMQIKYTIYKTLSAQFYQACSCKADAIKRKIQPEDAVKLN